MSGERRLFREGNGAPSLPAKPNFGLNALSLLSALAIVTLKFPGAQLQFMGGP
jgi:hypothetical protein